MLVFPFFGAFPSDCIPKGTKDAKLYLFVYKQCYQEGQCHGSQNEL